MRKIFALVDCNSFYCSCEMVFHPATRHRPVVVLSNNDGCAIAFNRKAKAIGFGQMCEPYYQIKERIREHNVAVFSSNYPLYDDMSKRVMEILTEFSPRTEVYSIDEAFLELDGMDDWDLQEYGRKIRTAILLQTGIPVGVGIAPTKVLAKMANKLTKKTTDGVVVLSNDAQIDAALATFPLRDLWGVAKATERKLHLMGIKTPLEFKNFRDDKLVQKILTKVGRELQDELRGISCLAMEDVEDKENIGNSRSFGVMVSTKRELREALATFATNAAEKLRRQDGVCRSISAFFHSNFFRDDPQYQGFGTHVFPAPTQDTFALIDGAHRVLEATYKPGFAFKKAGVWLNHISPRTGMQLGLFEGDTGDKRELNLIVDAINKKYGKHTVKSMACGIDNTWKTIAMHKSGSFTTNWKQLLKIDLRNTKHHN